MDRNLARFAALILAGVLLSCGVTASADEVAVPFIDGFESATLSPGWEVSGEGTVTVSNTVSAEGLRCCSVFDAAVALSVADSELGSNVWVRLYLKPVPYDDSEGTPKPTTNDVAGFYINSTGVLMVIDGTGYVTQATDPLVSTNKWLGFVVHLNYGLGKWDLYMTEDPYAAPLAKVNYNAFNFYTGAIHRSSLRQIVMSSVGTGFIDAVALGSDNSDLETFSNVVALDLPAKKAFAMSPPPYEYTGDARKLSGQLGDDLKKGLVEGDAVRFHASDGWKAADLDSVPSWQGDTGDVIEHGEGFWVSRIANSTNSAVFYPYNDAQSNAVLTIYGTNNTEMMGWSSIAWPLNLGARAQNEGNGWHFDSAAEGDKLWTYENSGYTVLKYLSASSHWSRVGQRTASAKKLVPGQPLWYQRRAGPDYTWDPAD